jgi:hypothetical protein
MTNIDDVKNFQLTIMEMEKKLRSVADQLTSQRHDLDELLTLHEIADRPEVDVVPVTINGIVIDIDAVVVCDATMNEMFEIHAKINKLIVNLQEVFDDKN